MFCAAISFVMFLSFAEKEPRGLPLGLQGLSVLKNQFTPPRNRNPKCDFFIFPAGTGHRGTMAIRQVKTIVNPNLSVFDWHPAFKILGKAIAGQNHPVFRRFIVSFRHVLFIQKKVYSRKGFFNQKTLIAHPAPLQDNRTVCA
jgi:hypothetical protein